MTAMPPDFETLLEPGERLLWQGRPDAAFTIAGGEWGTVILGLVVAAILGTFTVMAARDGQSMGPVAVLCFSALAAAIASAGPLYSFFERNNTWYALTSERAIIYFDARPIDIDLRAYQVRMAEVVASPAPGHRSVRIAHASGAQRYEAGRWVADSAPIPETSAGRRRDWPVAFERIDEAEHVARLAQSVLDGRQ